MSVRLGCPDGESEHAAEAEMKSSDTARRGGRWFRCRSGVKGVARSESRFRSEVVDLAVEGDPDCVILVREWLATGAQIDDAEATVAETSPRPTWMPDCRDHGVSGRGHAMQSSVNSSIVEIEKTADSAHRII